MLGRCHACLRFAGLIAFAAFLAALAPGSATLASETVTIGDLVFINKALAGVDAVVHLAAVVFGLGGNLSNQTGILARNTEINNNIFKAIARYPVRKCFYAGTVASGVLRKGDEVMALPSKRPSTWLKHSQVSKPDAMLC